MARKILALALAFSVAWVPAASAGPTINPVPEVRPGMDAGTTGAAGAGGLSQPGGLSESPNLEISMAGEGIVLPPSMINPNPAAAQTGTPMDVVHPIIPVQNPPQIPSLQNEGGASLTAPTAPGHAARTSLNPEGSHLLQTGDSGQSQQTAVNGDNPVLPPVGNNEFQESLGKNFADPAHKALAGEEADIGFGFDKSKKRAPRELAPNDSFVVEDNPAAGGVSRSVPRRPNLLPSAPDSPEAKTPESLPAPSPASGGGLRAILSHAGWAPVIALAFSSFYLPGEWFRNKIPIQAPTWPMQDLAYGTLIAVGTFVAGFASLAIYNRLARSSGSLKKALPFIVAASVLAGFGLSQVFLGGLPLTPALLALDFIVFGIYTKAYNKLRERSRFARPKFVATLLAASLFTLGQTLLEMGQPGWIAALIGLNFLGNLTVSFIYSRLRDPGPMILGYILFNGLALALAALGISLAYLIPIFLAAAIAWKAAIRPRAP